MTFFGSLLKESPGYTELSTTLKSQIGPVSVSGVSDIHKAHIISALISENEKKSLVICRNEVTARRFCRDLNAFCGYEAAVFYPERDFCFDISHTSSREYEQERISALCRLKNEQSKIIVAPVSAAMQLTVSRTALENSCFILKTGVNAEPEALLRLLIAGGYVRRSQIDGVGQFSLRGGILDIFCPSMQSPYRIEFYGDEIDSISPFDINSQRRGESVSSITVTPARENPFERDSLLSSLNQAIKNADEPTAENLQYDIDLIESGNDCCLDKYLPYATESGSLFDFIDGCVFVSETGDCTQAAKGFSERFELQLSELFEDGKIFSNGADFYLTPNRLFLLFENRSTVLMDAFSRSLSVFSPKKFITFRASQSGCFSQKPSELIGQLSTQTADGFCAVITVPTWHLAEILQKDISAAGVTCLGVLASDSVCASKKCVYVVSACLSACFEYPDEKVTVISFAGEASRHHKKKTPKAAFDLSSVSVGDYVVHSAHGIGIYRGIQKLEVQGVYKDYIKIQYGGSDVLYVPVTQLDMVAKYIGAAADDSIKLSRLASSTWKNTKARVSHAVRDMAAELIALYAKRMQAKGFSFSEDTDWQRDFEDRFPYEETPDQLRCVEEIKRDMESETPMDRVLCGDVGFGKTEVALRAAMKCVMDSKQCAILVPTTILAWQHYKTSISRFDGFPVNISMLSGFCSQREQNEVLKKLRRGETDIVIGTHRLIQKDVEFKNLGLAIIDEEQRFGVSHKERFKEQFSSVDMLTLSATPIPRTLNMAMSGIRDISMIEEAPADRFPVQTFVLEYNRRLLISAIEKELARGGQVYYLHNRIETINLKAAAIRSAIPGCRVAVAHGALSSSQLEDIWRRLVEHEIDILVCTTIIETGVDVANCNTMIIENADRMGLSQLYQLRGRIGRSSRRAYAYFTFSPGKELTDIASKRLSAIRDFTAFGSGFQIALRDLEIRGAGNILGAQQHGHMDAVGYDMYLKLLNEAIAEQKGEESQADDECLIDLPISAHIPESYISDNVQRIEVYRRIAMVKTDEDAMDVTDELIDRFGEPSGEVSLLIGVALLKSTAQNAGICAISQKSDFVTIEFTKPDLFLLSSACDKFPKSVFLSNGKYPYLSVKIRNRKDLLYILTEICSFLSQQKTGGAEKIGC